MPGNFPVSLFTWLFISLINWKIPRERAFQIIKRHKHRNYVIKAAFVDIETVALRQETILHHFHH